MSSEQARISSLAWRGGRSALSLGLLAAAFVIAAPTPGTAHQPEVSPGTSRGLPVPALAHSDMAIVAPYRAAIVALADRQIRTDETLRRLLNFTRLQFAYCGWGLVPGAILNEDSAFNECSHAYLAASWALLQHLAILPQAQEPAAAIERAIAADRTAAQPFVMCQYSASVFHTDEIIRPSWREMVRPASWTISILLAGMGGFTMWRRRASAQRT